MERRPWASHKYNREYKKLKKRTAKKFAEIGKAGFAKPVEQIAVSLEAYNFTMSAALMGIPYEVVKEDLEIIKDKAK